jgi:hypothetical protein
VYVITDVSEEYATTIFGVEEYDSSTLNNKAAMFLRNVSTDLTNNTASHSRANDNSYGRENPQS